MDAIDQPAGSDLIYYFVRYAVDYPNPDFSYKSRKVIGRHEPITTTNHVIEIEEEIKQHVGSPDRAKVWITGLSRI